MKKKILLILGHSLKNSFCGALADEYERGAKKSGAFLRRTNIGDIKFDPILHHGYKKIQKLEPDLIKLQKDIKWSNHIVIIFPVWWGGMPALLKGLIDRAFLPGFAFHQKKDGSYQKLLKGKSAHLFIAMGEGFWIYRILGSLAEKVIKRYVLQFSGIKPIKTSIFSLVENVKKEKRKKWLKDTFEFGVKQG